VIRQIKGNMGQMVERFAEQRRNVGVVYAVKDPVAVPAEAHNPQFAQAPQMMGGCRGRDADGFGKRAYASLNRCSMKNREPRTDTQLHATDQTRTWRAWRFGVHANRVALYATGY
jgi:hypothetical protein